ncbi:MAG: hypothetical protein ABIS74_20535 [Ferruginibacter sp.]
MQLQLEGLNKKKMRIPTTQKPRSGLHSNSTAEWMPDRIGKPGEGL